MLTPDILAGYTVTIATVVAALISTIVTPLVDAIPALNRDASSQRARDALLQLANLLLNLCGVLLLSGMYGQLDWSNWYQIAAQVIIQTLGSHAVYKTVKGKKKTATSLTLGPLHQQSAEEALPVAAADDGSAI